MTNPACFYKKNCMKIKMEYSKLNSIILLSLMQYLLGKDDSMLVSTGCYGTKNFFIEYTICSNAKAHESPYLVD
jgi:hypothetical protein